LTTTIDDDTAAILSDWGQVVTIVFRHNTVDGIGSGTSAWWLMGTLRMDIQPVSQETARRESGESVRSTHEGFACSYHLIDATKWDVKKWGTFKWSSFFEAGNRVRPYGWVAGDDEYEIKGVRLHNSSHAELSLVLVKGHGND